MTLLVDIQFVVIGALCLLCAYQQMKVNLIAYVAKRHGLTWDDVDRTVGQLMAEGNE